MLLVLVAPSIGPFAYTFSCPNEAVSVSDFDAGAKLGKSDLMACVTELDN